MNALCTLLFLTALQTPSSTPKALPITPPGPGIQLQADATAVVVIDRPGSYFLTGNLLGRPGLNGIEIRASGVTLDLAGHAVLGKPGSLDGIVVRAPVTTARIVGGQLAGWGEDGIDCANASIAHVEAVNVNSCGQDAIALGAGTVRDSNVESCLAGGIAAGDRARIERCTVDQVGGDGIRTGGTSVVTHCIVSRANRDGIVASDNSTVSNCVVEDCARSGITVGGRVTVRGCSAIRCAQRAIDGGSEVTVENSNAVESGSGMAIASGVIRGCNASRNDDFGFRTSTGVFSDCRANENLNQGFLLGQGTNVSGCSAVLNGAAGFDGSDDCLVRDSLAFTNTGPGITVRDSSEIRGCVSNRNSFGVIAASDSSVLDCVTEENGGNGIRVVGDCLVRGNSTSDNVGSGIVATGTENRIDSNHASDDDITIEASGDNVVIRNTAENYVIAPGQTGFIGPITFNPTNPFSNIRF